MNQENQLSFQQKKPDSKKQNIIAGLDRTIHSQNQRFCKICGAALGEGDLFCIQCGWKIDFSDENSNQKEEKPKIKISSDWLNAAKRQQQNGLEEELKNRRIELEKFKPKNEKQEKGSSKNSSSLSEDRMSLSESKMSLSGLIRQSSIHDFQNQTSGAKYFVHKDSEKTEYLIIKSVSGNTISGEIKTLFRDSSFANECFEGILQGNSLSFRVIQKDLHPAPGYRILADISFSGIIDENEDKIAGTIERENGSLFITYTKC